MSEVEAAVQPDASEESLANAARVAPVTAGSLLREAREAAGLHIAALAVALKVPVKKLEALEADRLDLLPDAVFVRALASSVCRTLKTDPSPILARLPQTATPRLTHDEAGINAPFRAPGDSPRPSLVGQVSRPALLGVLALLLGAVVLIFLPGVRNDDAASRAAAGTSPAGGTSAVAQDVPMAAPPVVVEAGAARASPVASATVSAIVTPTPVLSATVSTPTVASPTPVISPTAGPRPASPPPVALAVPPAAAASASALTPAQANGIVVFNTRAESWIEVTDAKGVAALRRIVAPGEAVGASGALPLTVIIGRADATSVQVRGKPFNLMGVSKDNVARFEVK